jgi:ferric-dicitrate binding protein FerR (iron transport regulator)
MASKRDRAGTYAQRLIENEYVQENLLQAADSLRSAYRRATKRRVEPTRDEKLRRQLRDAALSLREATSALQSDRRRPKRRRGRRVLILLLVGAGAAAAVIASNEEVRKAIFGGGGGPGGEDEGATASATATDSPAPVAT